MVGLYIIHGITILFISWILGMLGNRILMKTEIYTSLSRLSFIKSRLWNKRIGLPVFKWIVKNTFFRIFNQKIKVESHQSDLEALYQEMTHAEISHLIGFTLVSVFALCKALLGEVNFGIVLMVLNIFMNLYPSLLQQENKRRIDKLLQTYSEGRKIF